MLRIAALISSYLFHPLFMPTIAFSMIFMLNPVVFASIDAKLKLEIFLTILINTFFIPVFITFLMVKLGFIKSMRLESKMERIFPLGFSLFIYANLYFRFRLNNYPEILDLTILTAAVLLIANLLTNMQWKISTHTIGIAGLLGIMISNIDFFTIQIYIPLICIILVAGWVGTSRLILKAHTRMEVYSGYVIGLVCSVGVFIIFG